MNKPVKHTKEQLRLKKVERNIEITKNLLSGKRTVSQLAETHGVVKMQINAITLAVIKKIKIGTTSKKNKINNSFLQFGKNSFSFLGSLFNNNFNIFFSSIVK